MTVNAICGLGCVRVCAHPACALYGAGGICGRHGIYNGVACPSCKDECPSADVIREAVEGPESSK